MLKQAIIKEAIVTERAKIARLFLLLGIFLLSACPVKRSIKVFLFKDAGVERSGLNYNKPGTANGRYIADSGVCTGQAALAGYNSKSSKFNFPLFPSSKEPFFLKANSSEAHLEEGPSHYSSKARFSKAAIPTYLINRRLLI